MWTLAPRNEPERALAALALLAAVGGAVRLEELGELLKREEHRAWWAGHGRDVINAGALLVIAAALVLGGFPPPAALLAGGLMTLGLTGVSAFEARLPARLHPRLVALSLALLLTLAPLGWPAQVVAALDALAGLLF
jgi:hypothetical protein